MFTPDTCVEGVGMRSAPRNDVAAVYRRTLHVYKIHPSALLVHCLLASMKRCSASLKLITFQIAVKYCSRGEHRTTTIGKKDARRP